MKIALTFYCLIAANVLFGQEIEKKIYAAKKVNELNITIDGEFDEPEWHTANWENEFTQYEPVEGAPPYQQTEFAILYDENNVYVAIKALDSSPDSISRRLSRRDEIDGDLAGVMLDTHNDKRTAFGFVVSASGVKSDFVNSNDGESQDPSWDPIWWVKTTIQENGWYAEMRIPLTQLRFDEDDEQLWGFQMLRFIFRQEELSAWQPMDREKTGFVSQFGLMNNIADIEPKNTLDIMPYVVARTERFEKEPENPFRDNGKKSGLDAGLDAKIGLTNYLTLDLTVNPDFGQVEADPSEVNLTTYETFFREKRPFFVEGKNILKYKLMFGDGDLAYDGLFYSRRIGRRPGYSPNLKEGEYAEIPEFTKILGAAKITGKTKSGWSIGVLESVTAEENAEIRGISNGRTQTVEPLTNYFVTRLQKDFNEGSTYLGGMITAVNRRIDEDHLDYMHRSAYTGGIDFVHKWNNNMWMLDAGLYFSQVNGSKEAITRTQKSYIRTFQRPDADYLTLDTTRTSLDGNGGKLTFGKMGGNLKFMAGAAWKSPGLEINDIGYAQKVDNIFQIFWLGYRIYKPFFVFRNINLNLNQWVQFDYGGNITAPGGNINGFAQFKNYWSASASVNLTGEQLSHSLLRGGPSLKIPGYKNLYFRLGSNQQKKITMGFSTRHYFSSAKNFRQIGNYNFDAGYRPLESLRIELSPGIMTEQNDLQYVTQKNHQGKTEYIFAHIDRKTLSMSLRVNYNITPDFSIQYWGQPFIATGNYKDFKRITNSKADVLNNRFELYNTDQINYDSESEIYSIDADGDNLADYSFNQPDFNVKEFLSNLVMRWEYRPGSTVYLVWSQTKKESRNTGTFDFSRDLNRLFDDTAHNIFLIKLSYRLGR